jgi:hypothetical protein
VIVDFRTHLIPTRGRVTWHAKCPFLAAHSDNIDL